MTPILDASLSNNPKVTEALEGHLLLITYHSLLTTYHLLLTTYYLSYHLSPLLRRGTPLYISCNNRRVRKPAAAAAAAAAVVVVVVVKSGGCGRRKWLLLK